MQVCPFGFVLRGRFLQLCGRFLQVCPFGFVLLGRFLQLCALCRQSGNSSCVVDVLRRGRFLQLCLFGCGFVLLCRRLLQLLKLGGASRAHNRAHFCCFVLAPRGVNFGNRHVSLAKVFPLTLWVDFFSDPGGADNDLSLDFLAHTADEELGRTRPAAAARAIDFARRPPRHRALVRHFDFVLN